MEYICYFCKLTPCDYLDEMITMKWKAKILTQEFPQFSSYTWSNLTKIHNLKNGWYSKHNSKLVWSLTRIKYVTTDWEKINKTCERQLKRNMLPNFQLKLIWRSCSDLLVILWVGQFQNPNNIRIFSFFNNVGNPWYHV